MIYEVIRINHPCEKSYRIALQYLTVLSSGAHGLANILDLVSHLIFDILIQ